MITHRPCGACGELIAVAAGCKHWRPNAVRPSGTAKDKNSGRTSRRARLARDKELVAELTRVLRGPRP